MTETTSAAGAGSAAFNTDGITLRAATAADRDFQCAVFISTRMEEFTQTGWEPERIRTFLHEQFQLQHQYYQRHYPDGCFDIVELNGVAIGRFYHAKRAEASGDELRVIDIALLPEWRGGSVGTGLLHAVLAEAWERRLPVSLYVERHNPVRALYNRLGFVKTGENGVYEMLRRPCAPAVIEVKSLGKLRDAGFEKNGDP